MNEIKTNRQAERQEYREHITGSILFRIEEDLLDVIPADFSEEDRQGIIEQLLPESKHVLDALGVAELQNEGALYRHIAGAVANAKFLVHRLQEKKNRA